MLILETVFDRLRSSQLNSSAFGHGAACCYCKGCLSPNTRHYGKKYFTLTSPKQHKCCQKGLGMHKKHRNHVHLKKSFKNDIYCVNKNIYAAFYSCLIFSKLSFPLCSEYYIEVHHLCCRVVLQLVNLIIWG